MLIVDRLCRWFLAAVFFVGGVPKLFDIDGFAAVVQAYGIVPDSLVYWVAIFIPLAETVASVGLLFGKNWAICGSLLLMAVFMAVLSYGIWLGLDIDCGCFAVGDPEHEAFSGLRMALLRDFIFLVPLLFVFINKNRLFIQSLWRRKS